MIPAVERVRRSGYRGIWNQIGTPQTEQKSNQSKSESLDIVARCRHCSLVATKLVLSHTLCCDTCGSYSTA